ncbi:hypothetical protein [Anaeromyxobacter oryzae]|uniref:Uncharacterized protein n=1 Tax=Anaeromyxobacter oryzae TaxID=2918170 RepID=A0ABM7WZR3_9BACT|nr:hypothetical protein [Anaeromyxobacter oryzae]BDG04993.1 hypothetical protein AMOR_39890 [Anaeromyxobacter oryzae]
MTSEQAKQEVVKAEQAQAAAAQAVKEAQAAETTVRDQIGQAAYENRIADVDSLKAKLPAAEARTRLATLDARRAADALAHAKAVLGHMTKFKKHFDELAERARRVASIDAELRVIAAEAHAGILAKLEERQAAIAEGREAYAGLDGPARTAVFQGVDPIPALSMSGVLSALGSISPEVH